MGQKIETVEKERDAALAELREAGEALVPFSKVDLSFTQDVDDSANVMEYEGGQLVLGDFRIVHQVLSQPILAQLLKEESR